VTGSRLQDLLRKNKAEKSDADWSTRFNQYCGLPLIPFDWDQRQRLTDNLKPGFAELLPILEEHYEQRNKIFRHIADLLEHFPVEDFVLFPRFGADPSAFLIKSKTLLNNIACVLKVLELEACLSAPDGGSGIVLELNHHNRRGQYSKAGFLLLSRWGSFAAH